MKEWHFCDKVYRRWVVLMIGDFEEFYDSLKSFGFTGMEYIKNGSGMCVELTDDNNTVGNRCYLIWMPIYKSAILIHELRHMVDMIFEDLGIPISRENTEAAAFYTEYWWTEINKNKRTHPNGRSPKEAHL